MEHRSILLFRQWNTGNSFPCTASQPLLHSSAVWNSLASLIQLWECFKKQCLKLGCMTSAAVLLSTKPITLSQEEITLFWHNLFFRNPWWLLPKSFFLLGTYSAMCSTIYSSLVFHFLFPGFHVTSMSFFLSEKEPKSRIWRNGCWERLSHTSVLFEVGKGMVLCKGLR